ncbi:MAG: hypothetical protein ACREON_16150 [Gemmatimonadaceae bacterium]
MRSTALAITLLVVAQPALVASHGVDTRTTVAAGDVHADSTFARLVARLSEDGGYFDTENLISNEASYLHVLGKLRAMGLQGGAYVGVGPDQNFSYIAQLRPTVAFILDIRRENMLQHLLFKALFSLAHNRAEYLSLLLGRPLRGDVSTWRDRDIQQLVEYLDATSPDSGFVNRTRESLRRRLPGFGVPLSRLDLETIRHIHGSFIEEGLELRFTSAGRPARPYYPTLRQLFLEKDLTGKRGSYVANEDDFQFLKSLQERNLVVPVVGNFAGEHALAAIGKEIAARGERVTAFYTSNVEFYLMREGGFERFVENVRALPHDGRTVIVRSYFGGPYRVPHPQAVDGYYSTQLLQPVDSLLAEHARGGFASYTDLVTKHSLELR